MTLTIVTIVVIDLKHLYALEQLLKVNTYFSNILIKFYCCITTRTYVVYQLIDLFLRPCLCYQLQSIEQNMYVLTVIIKHNYMLMCNHRIVINIMLCLLTVPDKYKSRSIVDLPTSPMTTREIGLFNYCTPTFRTLEASPSILSL